TVPAAVRPGDTRLSHRKWRRTAPSWPDPPRPPSPLSQRARKDRRSIPITRPPHTTPAIGGEQTAVFAYVSCKRDAVILTRQNSPAWKGNLGGGKAGGGKSQTRPAGAKRSALPGPRPPPPGPLPQSFVVR